MNARDVIARVQVRKQQTLTAFTAIGDDGAENAIAALHSAAGGRWVVIDAETGRVGRLLDEERARGRTVTWSIAWSGEEE